MRERENSKAPYPVNEAYVKKFLIDKLLTATKQIFSLNGNPSSRWERVGRVALMTFLVPPIFFLVISLDRILNGDLSFDRELDILMNMFLGMGAGLILVIPSIALGWAKDPYRNPRAAYRTTKSLYVLSLIGTIFFISFLIASPFLDPSAPLPIALTLCSVWFSIRFRSSLIAAKDDLERSRASGTARN